MGLEEASDVTPAVQHGDDFDGGGLWLVDDEVRAAEAVRPPTWHRDRWPFPIPLRGAGGCLAARVRLVPRGRGEHG